MKDIGQVAVEVWVQIVDRKLKYDLGDRAKFDSDCIAVIKSAIEKSTEPLADRVEYLCCKLHKSTDRENEYRAVLHTRKPDSAYSVCDCGHAVIDHRSEKDHDECTIGECECGQD